MKFPFFSSFIIFILVLGHQIRKQRNDSARETKEFWDREAKANNTRKKPLDNLDYIHIPLEQLPMDVLADNEIVSDCIDIINQLSKEKIVNFTGYTNTDLKLEYGAPNITLLSEFDQRYTTLVSTLQKWADVLMDAGYAEDAVKIMEFALNTKTDVSRTYYKLAEYYASHGMSDKNAQLIETAESLNSLNKNAIIRTLKESYQ